MGASASRWAFPDPRQRRWSSSKQFIIQWLKRFGRNSEMSLRASLPANGAEYLATLLEQAQRVGRTTDTGLSFAALSPFLQGRRVRLPTRPCPMRSEIRMAAHWGRKWTDEVWKDQYAGTCCLHKGGTWCDHGDACPRPVRQPVRPGAWAARSDQDQGLAAQRMRLLR